MDFSVSGKDKLVEGKSLETDPNIYRPFTYHKGVVFSKYSSGTIRYLNRIKKKKIKLNPHLTLYQKNKTKPYIYTQKNKPPKSRPWVIDLNVKGRPIKL